MAKVEEIAEDIVNALEDLAEAFSRAQRQSINIPPSKAPVVNVAPPASPPVSVNPDIKIDMPSVSGWTFRITDRDRDGSIKEFTATPKT